MNDTIAVKKPWWTKAWEVIKAWKAWEVVRDILLTLAGIALILLVLVIALAIWAIWLIPYLAYIVLPWGAATVVGLVSRSYWLTAACAIALVPVAKWLWEKYARKWHEKLSQKVDGIFDYGLDEDYH